MPDEAAQQTVLAEPGPSEVALVYVPAGMLLRYPLRSRGARNAVLVQDLATFHQVPGSALHHWGADLWTADRAHSIGLDRHRRDRPVWQRAARMLGTAARQHPDTPAIVYVGLEQRDWHGREVWQAIALRRPGA